MQKRFTIDGSHGLETCLSKLCDAVREGVLSVIPHRKLESIVLGGGYGRGQGGVFRETDGDHPYNDMEFYVFMHGNRLLNVRRYTPPLEHLGEQLSRQAGLHVEFKIDALHRLRASAVSMFTYDLVSAHRVVLGKEDVFQGCEHHLESSQIPLSEATRLLLNRCTGLLLAKEQLMQGTLGPDATDFVARNIAKAQLALGDCLLTMRRSYHWSCLERQERLRALKAEGLKNLDQILPHHAKGVEFKLHPVKSIETIDQLEKRHSEVAALARELWLSLESQRLNRAFRSPEEYVLCSEQKCKGTPGWMNYVLNLRTFGWRAALDRAAARYPRERLLNTLPLLLWSDRESGRNEARQMLHAQSADWPSVVAAYKEVWPVYG